MSEIRVDTISEKTSANGVAIDSVTLKDGGATLTDNITFSASGKGVHLGVTTATSSNLLDDYEEGTWTIILEDDSDRAFTLSANTGTYIKTDGCVDSFGNLSGCLPCNISSVFLNKYQTTDPIMLSLVNVSDISLREQPYCNSKDTALPELRNSLSNVDSDFFVFTHTATGKIPLSFIR